MHGSCALFHCLLLPKRFLFFLKVVSGTRVLVFYFLVLTLCARDCSIMYNFLDLPYSPSSYSFPFFFVKPNIPLESSTHVLFNCIC